MKLTANMRAALEATGRSEGLRRIHTGDKAWPAHPATLAALLRHDLVDHIVDPDRHGNTRETWRINDNGRLALHPPPRLVRDVPHLLNRRTITRFMQYGVWKEANVPEPEGMMPSGEWKRRAERRHARDRDRRERARMTRAA